MTSANPKANPHQNFSSLFRSAIHWRATLWREFWNLFGCKMLSIQKHSFFWALLTRRPCAALALAANLKSSAKRIIEIATKGERGPERLCNGALKGIQKSVPGSEKPISASDWISGSGSP